MTEKQARQKTVELESRYRLLLHSTDQVGGADATLVAGNQSRFTACEEIFAGLLKAHPYLFEHLKKKYKLACGGNLKTKSSWPKKGEYGEAASDLLNFAYEEDLDLFGTPTQVPHFGPPE